MAKLTHLFLDLENDVIITNFSFPFSIAKAQYPNEFFTTMGGPAGGSVASTPPMVALTSVSGLAAGPQRGTLFTTQQQVTSTQSYHPYRRQP